MKRFLRLAAFGVAILPAAGFAQSTPAPSGPPGRPELTDAQRGQLQAMTRQSMAQMQQLHVQERASIIGSLSPVHRAAIASILGNLALTPNPDRDGAARQIDALLSSNEARAVLASRARARAQGQSLWNAQRQAFENVLTPDQRSAMDAHRAEFEASHASDRTRGATSGGTRRDGESDTADAGRVLLSLSEGGHEGRHGMGERGMDEPRQGRPDGRTRTRLI